MSDRQDRNSFVGPGVMLLSAAVFGYFGFMTGWNHHSVVTGQFLLFVALMDWTLKATAVAFGLAAVIAMTKPVAGEWVYCSAGLMSAVMFVIVAILDILDTQHTALHPFLLCVFAAWNGYSSWMGLKALRGGRACQAPVGGQLPSAQPPGTPR